LLKNTVKTKLLPENEIIKSLRPSVRQYWLFFAILTFCLYLAFTKFGVNTTTGFSIVFTTGFIAMYIILSVFTTKYVITQQAVLIRRGPFSTKFTEINYGDINSILIRQGRIQKYFKIGSLMINAERIRRVFRGIKNPYKVKEIINKEKAFHYEKRTLLRKIL
jgi:membrane protein YdbS with pleckstrin-like domain